MKKQVKQSKPKKNQSKKAKIKVVSKKDAKKIFGGGNECRNGSEGDRKLANC